jgi:phospholipid-translocating ATPase
VSGDRKDNVMAVGKNLDMFKPNSTTVEFSDRDNEDDLDIKMNMFLMQFLVPGEQMLRMKTRKGVDINVEAGSAGKIKSKELTVLIHGACFGVICSDPRLYQSFATLLSYATNLFAYSFNSTNKFMLCQTVKKFVTKNSKVLAIGDGLNDFMMLKEADLSIGIRSWEILQVRNTCDVIVSKFPQIVDLILVHGTWNFQRLYRICLTSFYANFFIIFPLFLHQNANNIGSSFFEINYTKLTLDILIINLSIILAHCFDNPVERPLIGLNSNVYLENFIDKKQILLDFSQSLAKAIVDSFIVYFCFYIIRNPLNVLGENIDGCLLGHMILYTAYATIYAKLLSIQLKTISFSVIFIICVSIGGIIGLTFIDQNIVIVTYQAASHLNIVLCSTFVISLAYLYEKFSISLTTLIYPELVYKLTIKFKEFIDGI